MKLNFKAIIVVVLCAVMWCTAQAQQALVSAQSSYDQAKTNYNRDGNNINKWRKFTNIQL